jgi:hypothetical protein
VAHIEPGELAYCECVESSHCELISGNLEVRKILSPYVRQFGEFDVHPLREVGGIMM